MVVIFLWNKHWQYSLQGDSLSSAPHPPPPQSPPNGTTFAVFGESQVMVVILISLWKEALKISSPGWHSSFCDFSTTTTATRFASKVEYQFCHHSMIAISILRCGVMTRSMRKDYSDRLGAEPPLSWICCEEWGARTPYGNLPTLLSPNTCYLSCCPFGGS